MACHFHSSSPRSVFQVGMARRRTELYLSKSNHQIIRAQSGFLLLPLLLLPRRRLLD